jgi:hypothetical protein
MGGGAGAVVKSLGTAVAAAALALALVPRTASPHALHVTYADIGVTAGAVEVRLRVYTDDLTRASGGGTRAASYVASHFALADRRGGRVALTPCGTTTLGDMTHLCFRAPNAGSALPTGARLTNDLLVALYADQINVVRVAGGRTMLFTRSTRVQAIG